MITANLTTNQIKGLAEQLSNSEQLTNAESKLLKEIEKLYPELLYEEVLFENRGGSVLYNHKTNKVRFNDVPVDDNQRLQNRWVKVREDNNGYYFFNKWENGRKSHIQI